MYTARIWCNERGCSLGEFSFPDWVKEGTEIHLETAAVKLEGSLTLEEVGIDRGCRFVVRKMVYFIFAQDDYEVILECDPID